MKLITILSERLVEWAPTTVAYAQDSTGAIYPYKTERLVNTDGMWGYEVDVCVEEGGIDFNVDAKALYLSTVADDAATTIVTYKMWKDAKEVQNV